MQRNKAPFVWTGKCKKDKMILTNYYTLESSHTDGKPTVSKETKEDLGAISKEWEIKQRSRKLEQ